MNSCTLTLREISAWTFYAYPKSSKQYLKKKKSLASLYMDDNYSEIRVSPKFFSLS